MADTLSRVTIDTVPADVESLKETWVVYGLCSTILFNDHMFKQFQDFTLADPNLLDLKKNNNNSQWGLQSPSFFLPTTDIL